MIRAAKAISKEPSWRGSFMWQAGAAALLGPGRPAEASPRADAEGSASGHAVVSHFKAATPRMFSRLLTSLLVKLEEQTSSVLGSC